ncbi:MAG: lactate racemization operon protein LarA, partial [Halanaerobiaceae bacterium]
YPLDQNIYQSVKGMTAAEATCRRDGVIIIAAECCDGHGGETFYNTFKNIDSAVGVMAQIEKRGRNETEPDQWESQVLARVLLKHRVIFVTELENKELVENMNMQWASDLDQALTMAEKIIDDKAATITVIPDGVGVIVE